VDAKILEQLIPIVGMLVVFGMPVAIVFVAKHFSFKRRELEAELEVRKMLSDAQAARLEVRLERVEAALIARSGQAMQEPRAMSPALAEGPAHESVDEPYASTKKDPIR
jgi:hypothetical protein